MNVNWNEAFGLFWFGVGVMTVAATIVVYLVEKGRKKGKRK